MFCTVIYVYVHCKHYLLTGRIGEEICVRAVNVYLMQTQVPVLERALKSYTRYQLIGVSCELACNCVTSVM